MKTKNMIVILLFIIAIQGEHMLWSRIALTASLGIYLATILIKVYRKFRNKKSGSDGDGAE